MKRTLRDGRQILALFDASRWKGFPEMLPLEHLSVCIVGGQATRQYMPERTTDGVDLLIDRAQFETARGVLQQAGYQPEKQMLLFPDSRLGLIGRRFWKDTIPLDLLASKQDWATDALSMAVTTAQGHRVVALPYLVLMKLDASRGIDQGDLTRMLGFANDDDLRRVREVVDLHLPSDREDLEQYIDLGQFELGKRPREKE